MEPLEIFDGSDGREFVFEINKSSVFKATDHGYVVLKNQKRYDFASGGEIVSLIEQAVTAYRIGRIKVQVGPPFLHKKSQIPHTFEVIRMEHRAILLGVPLADLHELGVFFDKTRTYESWTFYLSCQPDPPTSISDPLRFMDMDILLKRAHAWDVLLWREGDLGCFFVLLPQREETALLLEEFCNSGLAVYPTNRGSL